ncbi:uncharacterized protein [Dermacentor andersoni]|uniref:uncharacterized protein n=1 Tax=Dermacentor andersoni TaxID=34620 RepID=UPI002155C070|nr:uncharacterized protein LOC126543575 [Dermacentor andersoni]
MEHVREFGHPHVLLDGEDLVALRLEQPWPPDSEPPEGCFLDPADRGLLVTDGGSLVASTSVLLGTSFSAALFAGCTAFQFSDDAFGVAASQLLRAADKICVVHNRDPLHGLLRLFPDARVLVLIHDLADEPDDADVVRPGWFATEPRAEPSSCQQPSYQLRMLVRTTGAEGMGGFTTMSWETMTSVLYACPQIRRLDSPLVPVAFAMLPDENHCSTGKPNSRDFRHLTLDADFSAALEDAFISQAAEQFPLVEHLEVTLSSLEDFVALQAFGNLRSLSVAFGATDRAVDVGEHLEPLLQHWPRLEALSLAMCAGVRLLAIAGPCPRLGELRLVDCSGFRGRKAELVGDGFSHLRRLELTRTEIAEGVVVLLVAVRQQVRSLHLGDDRICSTFLYISCTAAASGTVLFPLLEELTLRTHYTVRALGLEPEQLHRAVRAMPALRHLQTDSYDLRLFFENYSSPPGCVSLSWCECVHCAVHCSRLCASSGFEEDDEKTTTPVGGDVLPLSGRGDEQSDAADTGTHPAYECDDPKSMTEEDERGHLVSGCGDTYPTRRNTGRHSASDRGDKSVSEDAFKHATSGRGGGQSTDEHTTTASDGEMLKTAENDNDCGDAAAPANNLKQVQ